MCIAIAGRPFKCVQLTQRVQEPKTGIIYSGVLLMSFVIVEYIVTNKPRSGLGTQD